MRVVVLGSGVVGVTTAYYLVKAGHEVTVIDRQPGPALETSFANAGEISPGYSAPWAAPGMIIKALKWLFMVHRPLVIWPMPDPAMLLWGLRLLANCTAARYEINKARMVPIAEYSRDVLRALRAETGIAYDERSKGTLQLFRTQKQVDGAAGDTAILDRFGVPYEVLDAAGCIGAEPALGLVKEKFIGGLRLPGDETGDCYKFSVAMRKMAEGLGVVFRYGVTITGFATEGDRISAVATDQGPVRGDMYVAALGSYAPVMLKRLGINLPIYPVKGYSITLPVADDAAAPASTIMDETHKVAITRLGDRIRVGGTAELCGYNQKLRQGRRATLEHVVSDLFPRGGDLSQVLFWCGLRPMTPDGPPIIGPSRYRNLYLNGGHGTLGWTMACGSGRVVSDVLSGRKPEIDIAPLSLERYNG
jgi:D-amino-acid dehydrogenase